MLQDTSPYSMCLKCLQYILCIMKAIYLKGFKSEQHIVGSLQINVVHHQLPRSQLHKNGQQLRKIKMRH